MKLKRTSNIKIAKSKRPKANTVTEPLDYKKWVEFIDTHKDFFTWNEDTANGIQIKNDIDKVPEGFKERVLASLNKVSCYSEFDIKKGYYNINAGFNEQWNWVSINFERTPKLEDLRIFVEMANYLDALLLLDGTKVINKETLNNIV